MPSFGQRLQTAGGALLIALIGWNIPSAAAARDDGVENQAASQAPASTTSNFTIYLRTSPIGSETVTVTRTANGWTIASSGRADVPIDVINKDLQALYTADWRPVSLTIDASLRGQSIVGRATVDGSTLRTTITQGGQTVERSDPVPPNSVFLPTPFWAPFEALSRRLGTAAAGSVIPAFTLGDTFQVRVGQSTPETLRIGNRSLHARRTIVTLASGTTPLTAEVWGDDTGRLMRVTIPSQYLEIVRDDIASVAVRRVAVSRAGDEELRVPANGFRLAATISRPSPKGPGKLPVVVLAGGAALVDRDEITYGVPVFGELAGQLADAGFIVIRYDRRATGQSGGRAESATLDDYADDLLAVVSAARRLPDADRPRLAVVGYGDGGAVALIAASRQKDIGALALVGAMGTTGAELNLWQVAHSLEGSTRTPEEKAATIELQKRIQNAAITGTGWDTIALQFRQQADSPWYRSFLMFDPSKVFERVSQPVLIVHGQLDNEVPLSNADRLEELARRRKGRAVEVVRLPGINHLLAPARTGEPDEYATLPDKHVSPAAGTAIAGWLTTTFAAKR